MSNRIATKHYDCGRYSFTATLPRLGTSEDREQWSLAIDGNRLPDQFDTLEAAMARAVAASEKG